MLKAENSVDTIKYFIENMLYPLMESLKGNRIRHHTSILQKTQYLGREELYQVQKEKLKLLLSECIKNVPAYKPYSYLAGEIEKDAFSALRRFNVLDKNTFRRNLDEYFNETVSRANLIGNVTGGSTGEPVKFCLDRLSVENYEAARWRGLSWWDVTPGSRSVMIWGNPLDLKRFKGFKNNLTERWLKNRVIIPAYALKPESIKDYVRLLITYEPEYIYGYSSALYAFSQMMLEKSIKAKFKLKAVVSTAETLHDYQRAAIGMAFGCTVVNEYGARDGGILAYQCRNGRMHISVENLILEVVDERTMQPLPFGESGILLVTDLNNSSMPRLRYKLGDRAALSDMQCDCGIGLPLLERIDGREDDMFVTVKGQLVHGHAFNHLARTLNSINRFQIVQYSPSSAELLIIMNNSYNQDEVIDFIAKIKKLLPETEITSRIVDDIPASPSGKYRYAIRKFPIRY